jgi:APA family basic amino acid/polyamine antiporter
MATAKPPASTTASAAENGPAQTGPASVTFTTATALAVADMIGIGVFTSLGFQVMDLPSGFTVITLWTLGGLVALCGALSYAELATALPRSGGEYNFLSRIYHPALGFLAGWISATVGFAAPVALAAMALGDYFAGIFPGVPKVPVALAAVWGVTLVLLSGAKPSVLFTNVSTYLKVALILVLIVAGFTVGTPTQVSFAPSSADLSYIISAPFAISLMYVMYSYSGWNAATYIADEIKDPAKTLPPALVAGVLIVMLLYVLLNVVFLYTTPMDKLAGQINVGLIAGEHIFGSGGGRIVGGLICFGLISAIMAMMWIGPRVTMVMGEDLSALDFFAKKSATGVPARALLLQLAVATVLILTQTFETVLKFVQFSLLSCSLLAVIGVIVLRITQPNLQRPFKVWAYPLTPLVFAVVTLFILVYLVRGQPMESLAGLALMATGLIVYAVSSRRPRSQS